MAGYAGLISHHCQHSISMSILSTLARIFQRPAYTSEITKAIETMKEQQPRLEQQQLAGRARLWDVQVNTRLNRQQEKARVQQGAYVYQTQSDYDAPTATGELP